MFQVLFTSKAINGIYIPIEGRTIFTSVNEAKIYMASHAMYPIVWTDSGSEPYPAYGSDARSTGFNYMIVRLAIFGNDAVVVPIEKIRAMREIIDRMERRLIESGDIKAAVNWLEGYPGQTAQQVADHKMEIE